MNRPEVDSGDVGSDISHDPITSSGIIDTHVHAWDAVEVRHTWLDWRSDLPRRPSTPTPEALRHADVAGMILVEAGADAWDAGSELASLLRRVGDDVLGIVSPSEFPELAADPRPPAAVRGIRVNVREVSGENAIALIHAALRTAARNGWALDVLGSNRSLSFVAMAARDAAGQPLVIDHLGDPPLDAGWDAPAMTAWRAGMLQLAALPDVVVKLSGQPIAPLTRDVVRWTVEQFGSTRCMLGSDWPVSESTEYGTWFAHADEFLGGLDSELRRGTAIRSYGLSTH